MKYPIVQVRSGTKSLHRAFTPQLNNSLLLKHSNDIEVWEIPYTSRELSYASHGVFRYFGKFPPPIARKLIEDFTKEGELVVDCMCGSGTTGVECLLMKRRGFLSDINPLALLIAQVKTTQLPISTTSEAIGKVVGSAQERLKQPLSVKADGIRNMDHWFLPETQQSLQALKEAIDESSYSLAVKRFLLVVYASIVRRVSRATTQQGRLFLDADTAVKDAIPVFAKWASKYAVYVYDLPEGTSVTTRALSMLDTGCATEIPVSPLVICHPPYFNAYRYSRVNSLELAWLGFKHSELRKHEVREAFKIGKAEKVHHYLDDMHQVIENLRQATSSGSHVALMIGDTVIKDEYIPVTSMLLDRLDDKEFLAEKIALRVPRGTEASWVASQRRKRDQVGVSLCDYVVILKRH